MSIKFSRQEAELIRDAFRAYEHEYGRFLATERKDLVNIKEALNHIHDKGLLDGQRHGLQTSIVDKINKLAGKEVLTKIEEENKAEKVAADKTKAAQAKIKAEAAKKIAIQEEAVKAAEAKLLEEKKAARIAAKKNVIVKDAKETLDIDDILSDI